MGWFDSEYKTSSNLLFQASGSVSLSSYYKFRRNIFYGSNFNTEITAYQLNKYKRNYKRDYNKIQLQNYGIQNNTLTYTGEFVSSKVEEVLASKADELGPLVSGNLAPNTSRISSYPYSVGVIPRDETYYVGLPSSVRMSHLREMIIGDIYDDTFGTTWRTTAENITSNGFLTYSLADYTDPLIQGRRKVVTNIFLSSDRRVLSFSYRTEVQPQNGTDANGNNVYHNHWQTEYTGYNVQCDVSAFTTHAIEAKYRRTYADNLSNVWSQEIHWTESIANGASRFTLSYPSPDRECLYMVGADILSSDLSPSGPITNSIDIDPVASLKESNTNMYDPDIDSSTLTPSELRKQQGLEKMFRSIGGSTSSYRDLMANPKVDDLSVGSFIDFNAALKSDILSQMGFDMFYYDDGSGLPKSSGTGVSSLSNCSGGSIISSDIPLGSSTMKIRAKSNQWSIDRQVFLNTYPTDDTVVFDRGLLWRVSVHTSMTEKQASGRIIQDQYRECLQRLREDYQNELGPSQYQAAHAKLFGNIEIRSNPESQPVSDIVALVLLAKTVASRHHTGGVYVQEEAHGSFSSLLSSCENHALASNVKTMRDKIIVSVPESNPTDANIITAVQKLGGKYKFFDQVSLKIKASSSYLSAERYKYASCRSVNRLYDADFGERNSGALVFTFLRLDTQTDKIDAVSLFSMSVEYQSTALNWTFKQWYGDRDKISFTVPIEFNGLFKSDTNFNEFMYLSTLTNGTLIYVHETTEIKWYQRKVWGMIFQIVLVVIAVAVAVFSFGSATSVSAFLVAASKSIAYAMIISHAVDFIVEEFDLNSNIAVVAKVVVAIYMGDQSGAMSALKLLDAGLRYQTAEIQDSINRALKDIDKIKKKREDLSKAYLLEESMSENNSISQWAKEMKAEMQTHLDVDIPFGVSLDLHDVERQEELNRYNPEPISLNPSVSIGNLFNSGGKIVDTSGFKHDDFLKSFPRR